MQTMANNLMSQSCHTQVAVNMESVARLEYVKYSVIVAHILF